MTIQEAAIELNVSIEKIEGLLKDKKIVLTYDSVCQYKEWRKLYRSFLITGDSKYLESM